MEAKGLIPVPPAIAISTIDTNMVAMPSCLCDRSIAELPAGRISWRRFSE
jgi:hypothetical protein